MISWKDKKTNNIVQLESILYCSNDEETRVKIRDGKGDPFEISKKKFEKNYEPVLIDYHKYQVELVEFCKTNKEFRKFLNSIHRRYHSGGYFHEGDIVFLTDQDFFINNGNYRAGLENPYKIHKIKKVQENKFEIFIERTSIKIDHFTKCSLKFDAWVDKIVPFDAFWMIQRYDMPY